LNAADKPMSARERAQAFWHFLKAARPDTIQVLALTPIPGTEDWEFLDKENRIFKQLGWTAWDGLHVVFQPDAGMSPQEVQDEVLHLHQKFYAFHYLGHLGFVSLLARLVYVGAATMAMPFLWFLIMLCKWPSRASFAEKAKLAWRRPRRSFRNAWRHLGAFLVIQSARKRLADFSDRLGTASRREDEDQCSC
jgi:radical SAM superfamily enzyme YgiQ (UPF0313 family)